MREDVARRSLERVAGAGDKAVTCTAAPRRIADQNALAREVIDVASGGVLRALGESGVFRRGQFPFEAVQHPIHDETLAIVQCVAGVNVPKPRLAQDRGEDRLGAVEGAVQAVEEPGDPCRDVEVALLRAFKSS